MHDPLRLYKRPLRVHRVAYRLVLYHVNRTWDIFEVSRVSRWATSIGLFDQPQCAVLVGSSVKAAGLPAPGAVVVHRPSIIPRPLHRIQANLLRLHSENDNRRFALILKGRIQIEPIAGGKRVHPRLQSMGEAVRKRAS